MGFSDGSTIIVKFNVEFVFPAAVSNKLLFPVDVRGIMVSNWRFKLAPVPVNRFIFVTSPVWSRTLVDQPSGLDTKNSTTSGSSPILLTVNGSISLSPGLATRLKTEEDSLKALSKTMSPSLVLPLLLKEILLVTWAYPDFEK